MKLNPGYGINRTLKGTTLETARARAIEALKAEGFGVLTEIDMKATLKAKIGVDMEPYVILGACNPPLAHKAVTAEAGVGLLLPCNVVVTQDGADAIVSAVSPRALFGVIQGNDEARKVADEVQARLERVMAAL